MSDQTIKPENGEPLAGSTPVRDLEVKKKKSSPVKVITFLVLVISILFLVWYILSDRHVPYTDQARFNGPMIPVAARVSGNITKIYVHLHDHVKEGDTLFLIDPRPFILAVEKAEANVDNTAQSVAARTASVKSAAGRVGVTRAQLDRAQRNWDRVRKVMEENPGALSQSDRDQAETSLTQAIEQVASAEADLERAQLNLGISGESNPQFIMAVKSLQQARLDHIYTAVTAPIDGYIESMSLDLGYYAGAGQPLATMVSEHGAWIQADMKENNLSLMKPGDPVEFSMDVQPGRIFHGTVKSIGYGISTGNNNRGDLPEIKGSTGWLADPQRFPVIISFDMQFLKEHIRHGGQVDVVVFTGNKAGILQFLGKLRIRIISWLSYVR